MCSMDVNIQCRFELKESNCILKKRHEQASDDPADTSDVFKSFVTETTRLNPSVTETIRSKSSVIEITRLKRRVGLISGISFIVGSMLGSGIFIASKGVLRHTGSVGLSLLVWSGCGVLSMIGALCYAELGTLIAKSGAEYAYLMEAFSPIPAYLFCWTSIIVLKTANLAIGCLTLADYTLEPLFDNCGPTALVTKLLAAIVVITVTMVNCYSVKLATRAQVVFTFAKLIAVVIIIIGGVVKLTQAGGTHYLENSFDGSTSNPSEIALAFYSGLWAYEGWKVLNFITEEIENPKRNLPRAIIIAIPFVTCVYVLTNISYLTVMSKEELLASPAVASLWADRVLKGAAIILPISVACSSFGTANASAFTSGRLTYVAAREGHLPEMFSFVNVRQYTPLPSLVVNMIITLIMIIQGDIQSLIDFFSFTAWIFYGITTAALLFLRYKMADVPRPYKVPIIFPIVFLLCSIFLVICPIIDSPQIEFLYAALFIVCGLLFYLPFVYFKLSIPGMDGLTMYLQLLTEVSPSQYSADELINLST